MRLKVIRVYPDAAFLQHSRLWDVLARVFSVRFEPCVRLDTFEGDGLVQFCPGQTVQRAVPENATRIVFVGEGGGSADCGSGPIKFSAAPQLHALFHAQNIADSSVKSASTFRLQGADRVIAEKGGRALWIHRKVKEASCDIVTVPPPDLAGNACLFEHFHDDNFFSLLPLLHFLRSLAGDLHDPLRPVRACLMFDDPNLHRSSYGFLDYAQLARHAEQHNYHAAIATIPLDAWYVSQSAAELFRRFPRRLSLLVHGNDHTRNELALDYADSERVGLLAQALQRISALERRAGVAVSRVMAPPHGGCSEITMRDMASLGFEAACISYGSLKAHNPDKEWTRGMGLAMAEHLARLTVIPRFNLKKTTRTRILLSAFLRQPIILVAHHQDLADGLGCLEQCAGWINALSPVQWLNMTGIARSNYLSRREGQTLHLAACCGMAEFSIPSEVTTLRIKSAWLAVDREQADRRWKVTDTHGAVAYAHDGDLMTVEPGAHLTIAVAGGDAADLLAVPPRRPHIWPLVRRQLTEGRDRLLPVLPRPVVSLARHCYRVPFAHWTATPLRASNRAPIETPDCGC